MEINKLIKYLKKMRDEHNVKEVHIPRLGYTGCRSIEDSEFDKKWIKNGILSIEGEYQD